MSPRAPWIIDYTKPHPINFYAFGAGYPDGGCHDGHIDDLDSDYCILDRDYRPCPWCNNAEYLEQLFDGGHFMPPYGYIESVPGDFFMPPAGWTIWEDS